MGLLDEAIRNHLDLKRRRGADPADIERAEREALGPVRRDPFECGPGDFEPAVMPDDRPRAYDHEQEAYDEGYEEYGAEEEWEEDLEGQSGEPRFAPGDTAEAGRGERTGAPTIMDHELLEDPEPPVADEPPQSYAAEPGAGDETMHYDVEEALAPGESQTDAPPEWVEQSDEWVEQSEPDATQSPSQDPEAEHRGKSEEEVFEEALEFLQDAADDDQLWFEQRPPRDFDVDG